MYSFREGELVSRRPVAVMLVSLVLVGLGCAGLPLLREENNAIRLWIPQVRDRQLLILTFVIEITYRVNVKIK